MASNSGYVAGLNFLSLDEGGITGLSTLYILREIMSRLQGKAGLQERPEPWEYFDLIAGTGTGAISAVMLGRLRMRMDDVIPLYNRLVSDTFSGKKPVMMGSGTFKATKLEEGLRRIVMEATGNPDEMMMEEKPQEARCKVVIYAMSAHHLNASLPCAFRTYPASANVMPDCPIWKALRASTAHPELFKSVEIEELGIKHRFVGGAFGCSNPTAQLLKEAGALFPDRSVASVISIGAGHSRTIQVPQPGWLERVLPFGAFITSRILRAAKGIATDNEKIADEMEFRFSNVGDVYYRLNVDQGIQRIKEGEWEKQSVVVASTKTYLQLSKINGMLDKLVTTIERRQATLATIQINGRVAVLSTSVSVGLKHCPRSSFMFKGRKLQLGQVCRYFGNQAIAQHVFVIHGLGGSGKSQTALKSAELMVASFEGVLFIDGSSRHAIEAALSQFAVSENIGSQFMDTLKWFEHRRGRWMMLFDNVDDPGVRMHEYFPRHGRYDVLITTRHRVVARLARGEDSDCNIGEMDPEEGLELLLEAARLQKGALQPSEYTAGINLLQEFGYLALAIVQCGAFIYHSQCSIAQYYKMYLDERWATLEGDGVTPLMIEGYERSVFTTWTLNNTLVGTPSDKLWKLIVFLDRNGISEEIFRRAFENAQVYQPQIPPTDLEEEAQREVRGILRLFTNDSGTWCSRLFLSAMGELVCLSLIAFDSVSNVYRLHPLVQQWARTTAPSSTSIENTSFLLSLSVNRNKTAEDRAYRREIVSHVNEILDLCSTPNSNNAWQFIAVYDEINHLDKAEPLETYVMETRIRLLGNEHPDTLESMRYVASTHIGRGRLKEAEQMFIHVLATRRRMLGDDHPDTLQSMANLAATYHYQGRLADTEALRVKVLAAQRRVLGRDHPDTLRSMATLATTHHDQGRLSEAESLFIEVLAARKRVFGADHPDTLQSMEDLATTYGRKGQLSDAESLQAEVLAAWKRVLGKDHPDTLRSMAGLAATYSRQGRLTEAELLELEVLAARKQLLGDNHPTTLSSIANLAATYGQQGRLDEAESLEVEVLSTRRQVLGPDHLDTLKSMADLAATRCARGRLADAEPVLVEVLAARKRVCGEYHPDTLQSMSALGWVYDAQGRKTEHEAIMAEIEAMQARRQV